MGNESSNNSSGSGFGQLGHDRVRRAAPPAPPRRRRQTRRSQSAPGSLEKKNIESDNKWNKEHADAQPVDLDEVDAAIRGCIAEFGPEPPRGGYARAALHKLRGPNAPRDVAGRKRLMEMARHCDATSLQVGKVGGKRRRSRRKRKRRRTRKQRGGAQLGPGHPPASAAGGYGRGYTRDVRDMDGQVASGTRFKTAAKAAPGAAAKKGGRRTRRQRGGATSGDSGAGVLPGARGYGRGYTRDPHAIPGQVQSGTHFKSAPPKGPGAAAPKKGGGRKRRRRRHRGKDFDKELKRVIAQHRRYQIARGDKRFKATKGLVKWSKPSKTKRSNRIYYRKRKTRRKVRRRRH